MNNRTLVLLIGCSLFACSSDDSGAAATETGIAADEGDAGVTSDAADASTTSGGGEAGQATAPLTTSGSSTTQEEPDPDPGLIFDVATVPDAPQSCGSGPNEDFDDDGFSKADGDCNDCDPNVNPGAVEVSITEPDDDGVVPDPADEDCDGEVDNIAIPCDGAISIDSADALDGAAALGLCQQARDDGRWGIVNAQYTRANGTPLTAGTPQHGQLFNFGPNVEPREGSQLLTLSSGRARLPSQPDACPIVGCSGSGGGTAPNGFPQPVAGCPVGSGINDDIALELTIRAPTNATGFSFDFDFYSFEYPQFVCDLYNDQFIALVEPAPEDSILGNVSFDGMGNPVSVNIAFFEVCDGCPLGTSELTGTGFDTLDSQGAGATSWLITTAPVVGGEEFTIRFMIWDTGDTNYDSTVLIDNFQWIADGGTVGVGTNPAG